MAELPNRLSVRPPTGVMWTPPRRPRRRIRRRRWSATRHRPDRTDATAESLEDPGGGPIRPGPGKSMNRISPAGTLKVPQVGATSPGLGRARQRVNPASDLTPHRTGTKAPAGGGLHAEQPGRRATVASRRSPDSRRATTVARHPRGRGRGQMLTPAQQPAPSGTPQIWGRCDPSTSPPCFSPLRPPVPGPRWRRPTRSLRGRMPETSGVARRRSRPPFRPTRTDPSPRVQSRTATTFRRAT